MRTRHSWMRCGCFICGIDWKAVVIRTQIAIAQSCGCISHIHHKGLLAIASQSSILLTIANSANHAIQSLAKVVISR